MLKQQLQVCLTTSTEQRVTKTTQNAHQNVHVKHAQNLVNIWRVMVNPKSRVKNHILDKDEIERDSGRKS